MATIEERLKDAPSRLVILAASAFARTIEHLLTDQRSKNAIEVAERFADGLATEKEIRIAEDAAQEVENGARFDAAGHAASTAIDALRAARTGKTWWGGQAAGMAMLAAQPADSAKAIAEINETARAAAQATQQSILDCLLASRIQHRFPAHVQGLATTIYENRDWSLMPILADALEELGLDAFAEHCRQPIHAKGCHVLDSILADRFR